MHPLLAALADALRAHGMTVSQEAALEGRSGTVYQIPLLVEAGEEAFLMDLHTDGVAPPEIPERLADIVDDVGAHGAILCHLEAAATPQSGEVHLWGRDMLVRVLGEAAFAAAGLDAEAPPMHAEPAGPPVAESLSDLLPPAFHDEWDDEPAEADPPGDIFDAFDSAEPLPDLADFGGLADAMQDAFEPTPEPVAAEPAAVPSVAASARFAHPLLPVLVTAKEAAGRVQERLFRVHAVDVVLQPVHLLDYECDLLAEGSLRYDTVRGRIEVHGTDKHITEVQPESVDPAGFTKELPGDVQVQERTMRVSEERAKERGRAYLVEAHTRMVPVQVEDADGSYSYTEKKRVAPRPDHVRLHHLGAFHRVLWRVRGPNGHADVDAITGAVVEEALASPDTGTIILD